MECWSEAEFCSVLLNIINWNQGTNYIQQSYICISDGWTSKGSEFRFISVLHSELFMPVEAAHQNIQPSFPSARYTYPSSISPWPSLPIQLCSLFLLLSSSWWWWWGESVSLLSPDFHPHICFLQFPPLLAILTWRPSIDQKLIYQHPANKVNRLLGQNLP